MVNKDQTTGIIERIIYAAVLALAMKLVQHGYIDSDMATYIATGAVAAFGSVYAWWINRPQAIAQAAANIPGTTVVTTPEIAAATPNNANIVSNTATKVEQK